MIFLRGCGAVAACGVVALVGCSGSANGRAERSDESTAALEATASPLVTSCAGASTLAGVDVSHYDGTINWTLAHTSGITFAFAKATESDNYVDPEFATNWAAMKAAGVVRGAYHFFDSSVDPTTQATYCLKTVGALEAGDLPIVLDFEALNGETEAKAVANAVTFLAAVTKTTGKTAILYMSSDFLSATYSALAPYTLWVANYGVKCPGTPTEWPTWSFWQSSDTGTVSGISSAVDLDTFNGTLAQLGGITGGSSGGSGSGSSSGASDGGSGSGSSSGSSGGSGSGSSSGGSSSGSGSGSSSGGSVGSFEDAGSPSLDEDASTSPPDGGSAAFASSGSESSGCSSAPTKPGDAPAVSLFAFGSLVLARRKRRSTRG